MFIRVTRLGVGFACLSGSLVMYVSRSDKSHLPRGVLRNQVSGLIGKRINN